MPFPQLDVPIVLAPLAGGPSTPALAAAVSEAGGLGFLAAGYKTAEAVRADIRRLRRLTERAFGVNLFRTSEAAVDAAALDAYAERIGADPADARYDDDGWGDKLAVAIEERVPVVSTTFGAPPAEAVAWLHDAGAEVWVTVTEPGEAVEAAAAGADALVVQGVEAGGHRGSFVDDDGVGEVPLLALLGAVRRVTALPLVAAGGIGDARGIAAALAAGARAAQLGTAFLLAPEAGTSEPHRRALRAGGETGLTRAFSGRRARGIVNRFQREHSAYAPSAYPHVHHLTAPLRAAARAAGDADGINLWAGTAHALAREAPAGELVREWAAELAPDNS